MDWSIQKFFSGVHNRDTNENIPKDAAQDAKNFITKDGSIVLSFGKVLVGNEGGIGKIYADHFGYKRNGAKVHYRKAGTKIQWLNNSNVWTDIVTGLTEAAEYTFNNFSTLSGAFTIATGIDGIYKFNNDSPGSYLSLYDAARNDKGYSLIDKGRMLMWNLVNASKTTLKQSWIDAQDGSVYTTETAEAINTGDGVTTHFHGFLGALAKRSIGTLTSTATNPADTETVTIGVTVYTFKTALSAGPTVAFEVLIGATAADTLDNLKAAINLGAGIGTTYSLGTTAHPDVEATTKTATTLKIEAKVPGVAGDAIVTTETSGELSFGGGTLASGALNGTRNAFALQIKEAATASLNDAKDGTLTGVTPPTAGTINYITGEYTIDFGTAPPAAQAITVDYQWEDSNQKGITDFTFSATRVAAEGNRITQDIGGDKIVNVLVGQDGAYYSLKEQSAYRLEISADDLTFTNKVYRRDLGTSFLRCSISTSKGIAFINMANPNKPLFTILQKNVLDSVEPVTMFDQFDFSKYSYADGAMETFDQFIAVLCKSVGAINNDTILLCNPANPVLDRNGNTVYVQTVDIIASPARMLAKDGSNVYAGSPITENVYKLFDGFDDDGIAIDNFWISKAETYKSEDLKKYRKNRFAGLIDPDQVIEVYAEYDDDGFSLIGTIRGDGAYVDSGSSQAVGTNMVGTAEVGGDEVTNVYPFYMEIKTQPPKFRKRTLKFVATGIGYFSLSNVLDWDILRFENKIPKRFRVKPESVVVVVPSPGSSLSGQLIGAGAVTYP